MNQRKKICAVLLAIIVLSGYAALNVEVSINRGIDGHYARVAMPLYVKWTQFLARHYEYVRLSKEITRNCATDEEKALAILDWTRQNIKDVPAGFPLVDEHILTIMIKGYGNPGQHQDVFTALCAYANIPAFWRSVYDRAHRSKYQLSFVRINGAWRVFDAYYGVYFRNMSGSIASVEDMIQDKGLIERPELQSMKISDTPYLDYYRDIRLPIDTSTARTDEQMPVRRILFEIRRLIGMERQNGSDEE